MELLIAVLGFGVFFWLGVLLGAKSRENKLRKMVLSKENVVACFKDVDWSVYAFTLGQWSAETPDKVKHFYKVTTIDSAIKKLNELLKQ